MSSPNPTPGALNRPLSWFFFLLLFAVSASAAESETEEDLRLPSVWVTSFEPRVWAGYKDNVLLAHQNPVDSALLGGALDATFYRLPIDGWEYLFLASGEYVRYLNASQVDQEAMGILQAQVKKAFGQGWKAGLSAEYIYFNQVFDASAFEETLQAIQLEGHGLTLRPSLSRQLSKASRLELELPANRQFFIRYIDDYWEVGPKLNFIHEYGRQADITVSYQFRDRIHDKRHARDGSGLFELGRGLEFYQHEILGTWRQYWDASRHWRTVTKLSFERNEDNGGGYYNYFRPQLGEQLRYEARSWAVRAEARVSYYQYDRQTIADPESPVRHKSFLRVGLHGEKALTKSMKVFAEYELERAISNLSTDTYTANTFSAGLNWEF
jgi:hypothetical protein